MELKVRIRDKEYTENTVQGVSISEEYNETLDSASLLLSHIPQQDFKPYEDVYIYSKNLSWNGYPNRAEIKQSFVLDFENLGGSNIDGVMLSGELVLALMSATSQYAFVRLITHGGNVTYTCVKVNSTTLKIQENGESPSFYYICSTINTSDNKPYYWFDLFRTSSTAVLIRNITGYKYGATSAVAITVPVTGGMINAFSLSQEFIGFYNSQISKSLGYSIKFSINFKFSGVNVDSQYDLGGYVQFGKAQGLQKINVLNYGEDTEDVILGVYGDTENANVVFYAPQKSVTSGEYNISSIVAIINPSTTVQENLIEGVLHYVSKPFDLDKTHYNGEWETTENTFYRHFLIDQVSEDILNFEDGTYSYRIELFSETKGLEAVPLPNLSITQPLVFDKKVSIYEYLCRFIELYSPRRKMWCSGTDNWEYVQKYVVDPNLEDTFQNMYPQDMSLNAPNLKELLAQLMITSDKIPYVKDDVIYARDITERKVWNSTLEQEKAAGRINYISSTRSSNDHYDGVRRQYNGAISQSGNASYSEYLGFRASDSALMTLNNLVVETSMPIYRFKKFYMCYYKKFTDTESGDTKYFLCKQDITPLIKLDSERALLSPDWNKFRQNEPTTIEELAEYRLSTLSYSIGSNRITGWGETYQEHEATPLNIYDITKSTIQNIFSFMDFRYPYGIYSVDYISKNFNDGNGISVDLSFSKTNPYKNIIVPDGLKEIEDFVGNAIKSKALFFEADYQPMFNGVIVHSKDKGEDNLFVSDSSANSLSILEKDGINQKEKINRFANKTFLLNGIYSSINDLIPLGVSCNIETYDDIIIFRRQYSIMENYIKCSYAGVQNYILKNFYTSVNARYRTYQLMSYGESISRAENKKRYIVLSKSEDFYDRANTNSSFNINIENNDNQLYKELFSAFEESGLYLSVGNRDRKNKFATTYVSHLKDGVRNNFLLDSFVFPSSKSVCFNMHMRDNASGGNQITNWTCDYKPIAFEPVTGYEDVYVGSEQNWMSLVDDKETGFSKILGFYFSRDKASIPNLFTNSNDIEDIYGKLMQYPKNNEAGQTNSIYTEYNIYKDNKELIDMTCQFEYMSKDEDVILSDWFARLNNWIDYYYKGENAYKVDFGTVLNYDIVNLNASYLFYSPYSPTGSYIGGARSFPILDFSIPVETFDLMLEHKDFLSVTISANINWKRTDPETQIGESGWINRFQLYKGGHPLIHIEQKGDYYYLTYKMSAYMKKTKRKFLSIKDEEIQDWVDVSFIGVADEDDNIQFKNFVDFSTFPQEHVYSDHGQTFTGNKWQDKYGNALNGWIGLSCNSFNVFRIYTQEPEINAVSSIFPIPTGTGTQIYKNMAVITSENKISKKIVYDELGFESITPSSSLSARNIFYIDEDENGEVYLKVDLKDIPSNAKSLQYWYFNDEKSYTKVNNQIETSSGFVYNVYSYSYNPSKSSWHFVFGVNISDQDKAKGYIKINIALMANRDQKVYDPNTMKQIGTIHNNANGVYIESQKFDFDKKGAVLDTSFDYLVNINYGYMLIANKGITSWEFKLNPSIVNREQYMGYSFGENGVYFGIDSNGKWSLCGIASALTAQANTDIFLRLSIKNGKLCLEYKDDEDEAYTTLVENENITEMPNANFYLYGDPSSNYSFIGLKIYSVKGYTNALSLNMIPKQYDFTQDIFGLYDTVEKIFYSEETGNAKGDFAILLI